MALSTVAEAHNTDTLTVFLKKTGQIVDSKDSADFIRTVLPPDPTMDKDLYRVLEYYPNGKLKAAATSLTKSADVVLDGTYIEYFMSGTRKKTAIFKNGRYNGFETEYYPNGKIYDIVEIKDFNDRYNPGIRPGSINNYTVQIVELRDSTGKLLVNHGTGHVLIFDDDFKKVIEEGDIKNYKSEGEWRGLIADSGRFIITFHKNEFKSGISYMKSGHHYTFKNVSEMAVFSEGQSAFNSFIKKNLQYPESARKRKISGSVRIAFDVETDGTLSHLKVERGLMKSMDDEALRVISLSPLWYPATNYGAPIKSHRFVVVDFYYDPYNY